MYSFRDLVTVYTVWTAACAGEAEGQGERRRLFIYLFLNPTTFSSLVSLDCVV